MVAPNPALVALALTTVPFLCSNVVSAQYGLAICEGDFAYEAPAGVNCFADPDYEAAPLLPYLVPEFAGVTVELCAAFCKGNKFSTAGVENSDLCFCGPQIPTTTV